MIKIALTILWCCFPFLLWSQTDLPVSLAYANHQTSKPFQHFDRFFQNPIHSGITAGTAFRLNQDSTHQLLQTAKLGYFHHRDNQKAVQLYSEFTYRFRLSDHWSPLARIGAGYLHAFPDMEGFTLQSNGTYEQKPNTGRAQMMLTGSIGIQYRVFYQSNQTFRIFAEYQPWFQYPFVNQYVPLLPYSALQVGIQVPVKFSN